MDASGLGISAAADAGEDDAGAEEALLDGPHAAKENMSEPAAATPRKVLMEARMALHS
jgi:hypothetical protein